MVNVSKNLKRLRLAQGLTQEQLAEAVHVTRQTISGWENGRTQPSVEMLGLLGEALDAEIEELIYGKKRNVGVEDLAPQKRRTLALVLTVAGALLSAVGLVLLFVWFWRDMGEYLRLALAFLPLLVGGGAGLYAVWTKKESPLLREGAAVLWTAGAISTVALVNAVLDTHFGFLPLLLADLILTLPLPFLLPSVFSYAAGLALICTAVFSGEFISAVGPRSPDPVLWPWFALLPAAAVCVCFIFTNRFTDGLRRFIAAAGLVALPVCAIWLWIELSEEIAAAYAFVPTYFLCLFLAGRTRLAGVDLRRFALFGLAAALFAFALLRALEWDDAPVVWTDWFLLALPAFLSATASAFYGRAGLKADRGYTSLAACMAGFALLSFLLRESKTGSVLLSLAFGVLLVVVGVARTRLSTANVGLVNILGVLLMILWEMAEDNLLLLGGAFFGAGALLLLTNRFLLRRLAAPAKKAAEASGEEGKTDA